MYVCMRVVFNPCVTQVNYDEEFDPVMTCVIDMATQYCDIEGVKEQDPWCTTLEVRIRTCAFDPFRAATTFCG